MQISFYTLDENTHVVKHATLKEYLEWWSARSSTSLWRHTSLNKRKAISTYFLGIDHSFGENNYPLIFETVLVEKTKELMLRRYRTYDEAKKGHEEFCKEFLGPVSLPVIVPKEE